MASFTPPPGYRGVKVVRSFDELLATPLVDGINALCWERTLPGDFDEVVRRLGPCHGVEPIEEEDLAQLALSVAGRAAVEVLLEDQRRLRSHGLAPELNRIASYPREETPGPVPLDVYSWHADSATVAADTWLCTYAGAASEILRNDEARRCVDVPETRAELLRAYGGADDAGFAEFLAENCYDLHYVELPSARPFSLGLGNLWRLAVDCPGNPVPPCVHRAPATLAGHSPRLLLIS